MHFVLKTILLCAVALLAACSEPKIPKPPIPDDVAKVSGGFVKALGKGDMKAARKFVAPDSLEDFDLEFEEKPEKLGDILKLEPVVFQKTPKMLTGPFDNDVKVIYAAERKGKWTVMEVDLFWLEEEKIEIDSWNFQTDAEMPEQLKAQQFTLQFMQYGMPIGGVLAALFLAFFVWLIRRKPQIISPDTNPELRKSAITSRSGLNEE